MMHQATQVIGPVIVQYINAVPLSVLIRLHTSHLNLEVTPIRIPIQEILQRLIIDVIMII